MSLQWTFIASVLYSEVFIIILMMLPFISAFRWQKIFRSRILQAFHSYANLYFNIFFVLLIVLFADSIRDMRRYMTMQDAEDLTTNPQAALTVQMKLFRSQRNFYIAGFTLFLFLVLRRLVTLIATKARLEAECDASMRQAESASEAARRLMDGSDEKKEAKSDSGANELAKAKKEVSILQSELKSAQMNLDAMRKQAESTNKEYDRLLKQYSELEEKLEGKEGSKKGN